jgi:hypothetical protein
MTVAARSQHNASPIEAPSRRQVPAKWIHSPSELLSTMNNAVGKENVRVEVSEAINFEFQNIAE